MISHRFLTLLGMENYVLKVYQSPFIRKLLNWGGQKEDFRVTIGMNNYLPYNKSTV